MRLVVSLLSGLLVTLALFYLMQHMIAGDGKRIAKLTPAGGIGLVRLMNGTDDAPGDIDGNSGGKASPERPPAEPVMDYVLPSALESPPPDPPAPSLELPPLEPVVPLEGPFLGAYRAPPKPRPPPLPPPAKRPPTVPSSPIPTEAHRGAEPAVRREGPALPGSRGSRDSATGTVGGLPGPRTLGPGSATSGTVDEEAVPLLKLAPEYPRKAARSGKEGWVKLEFTITRQGTVTDPVVVDARPRRIFDRAALRAIRKWRFTPKLADGKPVARRAVQIMEFKLARN
jgi:protein TonB